MKLIIASNNKNKVAEMKTILAPFFEEILSLREAGIEHETVEDGTSFMENALKKAREIAELSGCCAVADDSGLCVDALDGAPGIYSARFSGEHGDDAANKRKLLEVMQGVEDRAAHFTCAVAVVWPDGRSVTAEEYFHGVITEEEHGTNGFGYDPLFYVPEFGCTNAEMSAEQKNAVSHRGKALRLLVQKLGEME